MDYLMLVRVADDAAPTSDESSPEDWVERTTADGTRLFGERLQPAEEATTVRVRGGQVLLTDGPFAEVHEQIAGVDLLRVGSREEALAIASAHPVAGFGALELRELWPFPADDVMPVAPDAAENARYLLVMVHEPGAATAAAAPAVAGTPHDDDADEGARDGGARPDAWIAEMARRDVDEGGARLRPAAEAVTVRRVGGEVLVTDGPFAELREQVAGYQLLSVANLDEALAAAAAHPAAGPGGAIEVRALWPVD